MFALAGTRRRHGRDCESVEGIAIAQAIRGVEKKTSRSLFANFAVPLQSLWRLAEVIAVAFRDLTELLRSLSRFAEVSSWPLMRAHGILAIASAICGFIRGHILRLAEFIALAFLRGRGYIAIRVAGKKGERFSSQESWWQRRMAPSLEGLLEGRLCGPWGRSL